MNSSSSKLFSQTLFTQFSIIECWLFNSALPIWATIGIDSERGGFYEKIDQSGLVVTDSPRRTRVVARQIYSYVAAGRMGWPGDWRSVVSHGVDALFGHCIQADGLVISTYTPDGIPIDADFDFYDHAFALFALAELGTLSEYSIKSKAAAERMLEAMETRFIHPIAGFRENDTDRVPLRANPHMHMLEACLAHARLPDASPRWQEWADQIVSLAKTRFIDRENGGLREFFDFEWKPMPDDSGRLIEPGHQFEWSWLLHQWNNKYGDPLVNEAANQLCEIGETYGVNVRGLTIDELWDDFSARKKSARNWPQTERTKACLEQATRAGCLQDKEGWENKVVEALMALQSFFNTEIEGLWYDSLDDDGKPINAAAPTSSLYHIVCAMETCKAYLSLEK